MASQSATACSSAIASTTRRSTWTATTGPGAKLRQQTRSCPSDGLTHGPQRPFWTNRPRGAKARPHDANGDGDLSSRTDSAVLFRQLLTELAYYEADKRYLPIEKCAERCRLLSALLTAAVGAHDSRSLGLHQPPARQP